jgi:RNA polymerase sigma-70 factor (ECF subfamily)
MDELPARTRIALEMRRIEGAKLRDIAQRLGVSVPVAHSIVAEGIAYCRRRVRPLR